MKQQPGILKIFWTFFRIGAFTFGGGYAMLPLVQRDVVETNDWIDEDDFLDILALSQSVPGAIAVNSAILIGYRLRKGLGVIPALAGVVLPSLSIITVVAYFFARFQSYPLVQSAFAGVRPAVVGLIAAAVLKLGRPVLKRWKGFIFFILFLAASYLLDLHPILIIVLGAVSGPLFYRLENEEKLQKEGAKE